MQNASRNGDRAASTDRVLNDTLTELDSLLREIGAAPIIAAAPNITVPSTVAIPGSFTPLRPLTSTATSPQRALPSLPPRTQSAPEPLLPDITSVDPGAAPARAHLLSILHKSRRAVATAVSRPFGSATLMSLEGEGPRMAEDEAFPPRASSVMSAVASLSPSHSHDPTDDDRSRASTAMSRVAERLVQARSVATELGLGIDAAAAARERRREQRQRRVSAVPQAPEPEPATAPLTPAPAAASPSPLHAAPTDGAQALSSSIGMPKEAEVVDAQEPTAQVEYEQLARRLRLLRERVPAPTGDASGAQVQSAVLAEVEARRVASLVRGVVWDQNVMRDDITRAEAAAFEPLAGAIRLALAHAWTLVTDAILPEMPARAEAADEEAVEFAALEMLAVQNEEWSLRRHLVAAEPRAMEDVMALEELCRLIVYWNEREMAHRNQIAAERVQDLRAATAPHFEDRRRLIDRELWRVVVAEADSRGAVEAAEPDEWQAASQGASTSMQLALAWAARSATIREYERAARQHQVSDLMELEGAQRWSLQRECMADMARQGAAEVAALKTALAAIADAHSKAVAAAITAAANFAAAEAVPVAPAPTVAAKKSSVVPRAKPSVKPSAKPTHKGTAPSTASQKRT